MGLFTFRAHSLKLRLPYVLAVRILQALGLYYSHPDDLLLSGSAGYRLFRPGCKISALPRRAAPPRVARLLRVGNHDEMSRYHDSAEDVPDGLPITKWSWQGLISGAESDDI